MVPVEVPRSRRRKVPVKDVKPSAYFCANYASPRRLGRDANVESIRSDDPLKSRLDSHGRDELEASPPTHLMLHRTTPTTSVYMCIVIDNAPPVV
jgi:hypothetical protein